MLAPQKAAVVAVEALVARALQRRLPILIELQLAQRARLAHQQPATTTVVPTRPHREIIAAQQTRVAQLIIKPHIVLRHRRLNLTVRRLSTKNFPLTNFTKNIFQNFPTYFEKTF